MQDIPIVSLTALMGQAYSRYKWYANARAVDMCCLSPNIFLQIIRQKFVVLPWPRPWAAAKVQAFRETLVKSMKMVMAIISFICILQLITLLTIWSNLHTSAMTYLKQPQNEHTVRSWHILWSWGMCLPLPTALLLSPIQPNHSSQSMTSCTCHCKQCQDQPHHLHDAGRQFFKKCTVIRNITMELQFRCLAVPYHCHSKKLFSESILFFILHIIYVLW